MYQMPADDEEARQGCNTNNANASRGSNADKQKLAEKGLSLQSAYPGALFSAVQMQQDEPHSLFKSVLIAREWYLNAAKGNETNRKRWKRFAQGNSHRLDQDLQLLLIHIKIVEPQYDLYKHGHRLQDFLDYWHPQRFRIFLFQEGQLSEKPIWCSAIVAKSRDYQDAIAIWYEKSSGRHLPLRHPGRLFRKKGFYCFACQKPYTKAEHHSIACANRCKLCHRVGTQFPCRAQPDFVPRKCNRCALVFHNPDCLRHHQLMQRTKKQKRNVCERNLICVACGRLYRLNNGHRCRVAMRLKQEKEEEEAAKKKKNADEIPSIL